MRWICALALCLAFIGCNDKDPSDGSSGGSGKTDMASMKPTDLHGKWNVDVKKMTEAQMQTEDFKKLPPEKQAEAKKQMEEMLKGASMAVEFMDGGKMTMSSKGMGMDDDANKADWKVMKQDGAKWTLETKDEGKEKAETMNLEWLSKDHVKLTKEGDEMVMEMNRAK